MEIQQHDGVVVEVAGSRQGFAKHKRGGRGVAGGEGGARGCGAAALPPPLYIGPWGGYASPGDEISGGAAATRGGRGCLAPQGKGELPP